MNTTRERVDAAKALMEAQRLYDSASTRWYGLMTKVTEGHDLHAIGQTWHPQYNQQQNVMSDAEVAQTAPVYLEMLEAAEENLVAHWLKAEGKVIIPRPMMRGPATRCFWFGGEVFEYSRTDTIRIEPGYHPYPFSAEDPLRGEYLRLRWELLCDYQSVREFLQEGGFLWELETWMKLNKVWLVGPGAHRWACPNRADYVAWAKKVKVESKGD